MLEERSGFAGRQRRQRKRVFAGDAQHFARSDEQRCARRALKPLADAFLGVARDLFKIVQHQQAGAATCDGHAQLSYRIALAQRHLEALGNRVHDAVQRPRLREIAEPGAARIVTKPGAGVAQRQAGLADAPHAENTDQPGAPFKGRRNAPQRLLPTDEGVAFSGQVVRQRLQGRPGAAEQNDAVGLGRVRGRQEGSVGLADLEKLHRVGQALQAPMPVALRAHGQVAQRRQR